MTVTPFRNFCSARAAYVVRALVVVASLWALAGCEAAPSSTATKDVTADPDVAGSDAAATTDTAVATDTAAMTETYGETDVVVGTDVATNTDVATATDIATGPCAGKADGAACDDGDPCTETACEGGGCKVTKDTCSCASNADCPDDANLCNGTPYCDLAAAKPVCKTNPASVVTCQAPANSCEEALCSPSSGSCVVVAKANNTACDDGKACTVGDVCTAGQCVAGTDTCPCTQDADCAKKEDGNLCNGTLFCNKSSGQCQVNPASVVSCPNADDTTCSQNTCDPKTGACAAKLASNGAACDDGNPCTANETCQQGSCIATANTCICTQDADCADEEDGNFCNGTLYCDIVSGSCKVNPATVVNCPDSFNDCAPNVCEPTTGKCGAKTLPANTPCDDGDVCTAVGTCADDQCQNGVNICACVTDGDCTKFEDGNVCNGTLYCNKAKNSCEANPATVKSCPSVNDTPCVKNLCQAKTGLCAPTTVASGPACDSLKRKLGEACDPDLVCGSYGDLLTDEEVQAWQDCRASQCEGGVCYKDVCTRLCEIGPGADIKNNLTGAPGADGVVDNNTDAGCEGAVAGPLGQTFRCVVVLGSAQSPELAYCQPGTNFAACTSNTVRIHPQPTSPHAATLPSR